jgi:CubicO group peptidase (beta-lactamase class C family)
LENKEFLTKREELDRFLDEAETPFSDISIYYDHKEIYRHFSGCSNDERTKKTDGSELYFIYSLTKVMTAVATMQLVERSVISLDDPVSNYLPYKESCEKHSEQHYQNDIINRYNV